MRRRELDEREIEQQLARRAAGEWHAERVLPAVRRSMAEVRTERVAPARRWPALAGLAGLLGAVVVLAVALPRLDSGPAGEAPAPTPPELVVLSTDEFAAQFAAGELARSLVLVEGSIGSLAGSPPPGGLDEWACPVASAPLDRACFMGTLAGPEPPIHIYTRHIAAIDDGSVDTPRLFPGEEDGWPVWFRAEPPVSGVLLLQVTITGEVEYAGRLWTAPPTVATVAQAAGTEFADLSIDEIMLVDAWLSQGSCAHPNAWCVPPAWLWSDRPTAKEATDDEGDIRVQHGAMHLVRGDRQAEEPVRGRFALARRPSADGCPADAPACWRWHVISALWYHDPTTGQVPPDIATPALPTAHPTQSSQPRADMLNCSPFADPGADPASPRPGDPPLDIQLTDRTATVVTCAYFSEFATLPAGQSSQTRWHAPDELGVTWNVAHVCPSSARLQLDRVDDQHVVTLDQQEIVDCGAQPGRQGVVIWFDGPVQSAADVIVVTPAQ